MALKEWDAYGPGLSIPLIREPLQQLTDGCKFAAFARFIEYELRIAYGNAFPYAVFLAEGDLVDHNTLRDSFFSTNPPDHRVSTVLKFAKKFGLPMWNNHRLKIRGHDCQLLGEETDYGINYHYSYDERLEMLREFCGTSTVLGTMVILKDYRVDNAGIYMGKNINRNIAKRLGNHTVVILGLRPYRGQVYFVYQDSRGPANGGLLGMGRNLAHVDVLLKIYKVELRFPTELLPLRA